MAEKNTTYTVIHDFKDLQDKNKIYRAGDFYPSPANKKVSEKRINELKSKNNKNGIQYIRETHPSTDSKK